MGRLADSLTQSQRYVEVDPRSPAAHNHLAHHYLMAGQNARAVEECNRALALDPGVISSRQELAAAYAGLRRYTEAVDEYEKLLPSFGVTAPQIAELRKGFERGGWKGFLRKRLDLLLHHPQADAPTPTEVAGLYAELGEMDAAFQWLERAFAAQDEGLVYLNSLEFPASVHADPRFRALLNRLHLPPPS